jgi:hypothetical protein
MCSRELRAITAGLLHVRMVADVDAIYLQQLWDTVLIQTKKKLRCLWSASELYRLIVRHFLAKFSENFH